LFRTERDRLGDRPRSRGSATSPFYRVSELLEANAPRAELVVWTGFPALPALVALRPVPVRVRSWK